MWHSGLVADLPDGWSRFDSRLSCFFSLLYNFFSFCLICFWSYFSRFLVSLYSFCWPITAFCFFFFFFCNKRIPSNVYILILPLCMNCLTRYEALGKFSDHSKKLPKQSHFHTKTAQIRGFRASLLRVAPGCVACGLLSRLWLLTVPLIQTTSHSTILFLSEFWMS